MNICTALWSFVNFCYLSQSEVSTENWKVSTFFAFQYVRCRCCYRSYLDRFLKDIQNARQTVLKINWSVKTPWHERMEVARSELSAPDKNEWLYMHYPTSKDKINNGWMRLSIIWRIMQIEEASGIQPVNISVCMCNSCIRSVQKFGFSSSHTPELIYSAFTTWILHSWQKQLSYQATVFCNLNDLSISEIYNHWRQNWRQ